MFLCGERLLQAGKQESTKAGVYLRSLRTGQEASLAGVGWGEQGWFEILLGEYDSRDRGTEHQGSNRNDLER